MSVRVALKLVVIFALVACSSNESTTTPEGFLRPEPKDDEGTFWSSGFGVIIPAGEWEPNENNPKRCQLIDNDGWHVTTDAGLVVALPGEKGTFRFDTASSKVAAPAGDPEHPACWARGAVLGDYEDLGQSYTVTNGRLAATFTAAEFLDGQDGTRSVYKPLQPA